MGIRSYVMRLTMLPVICGAGIGTAGARRPGPRRPGTLRFTSFTSWAPYMMSVLVVVAAAIVAMWWPVREPDVVIVNMKFLERRGMHPLSAIGIRIQFIDQGASASRPWKEIVGVVSNIESSEDRCYSTERRWSSCPRRLAR